MLKKIILSITIFILIYILSYFNNPFLFTEFLNHLEYAKSPEFKEIFGKGFGLFSIIDSFNVLIIKNFELKINTNATRLNEKLIHQILQSGVTDMVFSIDSFEKEEYESIRVLGIFEDVLNNVKKFKVIKDEFYPNSKCSTRVSGVKVRKTQDTKKFQDFWQKYVDHVVCVEMEERWDTYKNIPDRKNDHPCVYLWERLYIWFDGVCNPCDADYKSFLSPGNLKTKTIKQIWHSEELNKLRKFQIQIDLL